MRKKLFSLTKKDFEIQTFSAGGKGGQNQNRRSTGVRVIHGASRASGEGRDSRSQEANRRSAFLRCVGSREFKDWHRAEVCRRLGYEAKAEKAAEAAMTPQNLKVEVRTERGWEDDGKVADDQR